MKKKIIIALIVIILLIVVFFATKNPLAKEIYDGCKNIKSYIVVKTSDEYNKLDSEKKYYKSEKNIRIPILIYHEIPTEKPTRDLYYMQTTATQFEKQIKGLLEEGYTFISYQDLADYYDGAKALSEKSVLIGFDDGWADNYYNAFPILKKYNIPAAIYVVDDLVGTDGYFNWEQAEEMSRSGLISIFSHGRTHIFYDKESVETLISDVEIAYENIEKHVGKAKIRVFTYPYGACRQDQIEALYEKGYIQNMTDDEINKSDSLELKSLHRYYVKQNESAYKIIRNINELN
ncbi:MAG: polysaccharide deacetylase family protein [Clostridia bacterium]|nr:polysaccharide deacetylase family protein [Clostridia bacterium]